MEAFGMHLLPDRPAPPHLPSVTERLAFLDAGHETTDRIVELCLRGCGKRATRLSEQHSINTPARQASYLPWHDLQMPYMYRQWSVIS